MLDKYHNKPIGLTTMELKAIRSKLADANNFYFPPEDGDQELSDAIAHGIF
jgi:hypothetical protein